MLAEQVESVIGVDTHAATHALAVVAAASGGVLAQAEVKAERTGYRSALRLAGRAASGRRVRATRVHQRRRARPDPLPHRSGEQVVELDRPARGGRRTPQKSDELDAVLAARTALGRAHLAIPRDGEGHREAIRVLMVASSGQVVRHRLDRGGDRQLNRALHTIVLARRKSCAATQDYLGRRQQEGRSAREAIRCLKRSLARSLFRRLEALPGA